MVREVSSFYARQEAARYGEIVEGTPRDDGGWNFLVVDPRGYDILVSVTRDEDGSLASISA